MKKISKYIPSMYQRRLLLLMGGMVLLGAAPAVQMVRLGVVRGRELREEAERRLVSQEWLDNVRGSIVDRKGRVLAMDRASMDIAFDYQVITGEWADQRALRRARQLHRGRWAQMSPEQRDEAVQKALPEFDERLRSMWEMVARVSGVPIEQIETRKGEIREQVQLLATLVTERQRRERQRELAQAASEDLDEDALPDVRTSDVRRPIREEGTAHVVLADMPDTLGFEFERLSKLTIEAGGRMEPAYPGMRVLEAKRRDYPLASVDVPVSMDVLPLPLRRSGTTSVRVDGVATQLLGWMRGKLHKEDVEARPMRGASGALDFGHYRPGDSVGQGGFEQAAEAELRGERGLRVTHLDTGAVDAREPTRGRDVALTIDVMLQARIQALFDPELGLAVVQPWHKPKRPEEEKLKYKEVPTGTPLHGAVVVVDVATGDVLAMVSAPSFTREKLRSAPDEIFKNEYDSAYLNRAIDKPYPPGSIVKPLVLAAAGTAGRYAGGERIACTGHFYPDKPLLYRCWIFKQFHDTHSNKLGHDLDGSEAIKVSCNIFFFELGRRLGPASLCDWYTRFGVGQQAERWNLFGLAAETDPGVAGLLHEQRGNVPTLSPSETSEAVLMGIGQGKITWTPLHAADAFATLARGGLKLTPRLRAGGDQVRTDLRLDAAAVAQAIDGLRRSANEELGTTYSVTYEMPDGEKHKERVFTAPVKVWAKSGTADAPPFVADLSFNGAHEAFDGDHSWCVLLAGENRPDLAIAVVIDHGGSGGRVAGPMANQVLYSLIAEGYLRAGVADAGGVSLQRGALSP